MGQTADLVLSDHDQLGGLGDDDHVQYALANKTRPSPWVAAGDLAGLSIADLGTRDHDLLTGLADDDHVQYALADKSRPAVWVSAADLLPRSIADLGTRDHDLLTGLADDDHTQYALANKTRPTPWVAAGDLATLSIGDLGTRDHDLLTGLLDDDHTQYALANKTRPSPWVAAGDLTPRSLADLGTRSHADLQNLGAPADDHPQYALADKSRPTPWVAAGDLSALSIADLGTRDHDLLTGLGDDDHTQYLLINGTRAMTGGLDMATNPIDNLTHARNVGSNFDLGGTVADPLMRGVNEYSLNFWPTGRTISAAVGGPLNWTGSDTFSVFGGTYPTFVTSSRTVTNTLPYAAAAMNFGIFLNPTFQNQNGVAANLGLSVPLYSAPVYRADGATITQLGHAGLLDNPSVQDVNGGALLLTYVINAYLTANYGAVTGATNHIHLWTPNPGGAGPITNHYGWFHDDMRGANAYGIFSLMTAGATKWFIFQNAGGAKIQLTGDVGFFGTAPVGQQTVTGSRGGNAALASLLTALAAYGLIVDSTTP